MNLSRGFLGVMIGVLSTATVVAQSAAPAGSAPRFVGLWGATRSFGPEIRGELTITLAAGGPRAAIGGTLAPVKTNGAGVAFTLAGDLGSFRGRRDASGARIRGQWIQPAGPVTGVAWATPVDLRPIGPGVWRGTVSPFEESVTLYMDVRADSAGVVKAVFRNPDGFFGNAKFTLVAEGNHFRLLSIDNGAALLEGDYDEKHDRLLLPVPDGLPFPELRATLALTRQSRDEAVGYYPRTPAEPRYVYRRPTPEADGWRTATLEAAGLDTARISALVQQILDTDPWPQTAPLVQGLLIARHGKLVLEEYFYGFDKERPHDLRARRS